MQRTPEKGVCKMLLGMHALHHVEGKPVVNGFFKVRKDELAGDVQAHRLIMDLRPCSPATIFPWT